MSPVLAASDRIGARKHSETTDVPMDVFSKADQENMHSLESAWTEKAQRGDMCYKAGLDWRVWLSERRQHFLCDYSLFRF